jgi:hypothetical protein
MYSSPIPMKHRSNTEENKREKMYAILYYDRKEGKEKQSRYLYSPSVSVSVSVSLVSSTSPSVSLSSSDSSSDGRFVFFLGGGTPVFKACIWPAIESNPS